MGIENYVPVQRKTHLWSDRRKQIDHIVIPMKIFVRVDAQEQKDVLMLSAVSRYMVLHGESAPGCYTRYPNGEVQIHVRLFGGSGQYE